MCNLILSNQNSSKVCKSWPPQYIMQFAFSVTKVCKTDVATHAIAMLFVNPYLLIWPEPYNQACSSHIMEELVEEFQDMGFMICCYYCHTHLNRSWRKSTTPNTTNFFLITFKLIQQSDMVILSCLANKNKRKKSSVYY